MLIRNKKGKPIAPGFCQLNSDNKGYIKRSRSEVDPKTRALLKNC